MISESKDRFLVLLLTISTLVLQEYSYNRIVLLLGILTWIAFSLINKKEKVEVILTRMLILSVPLSFVSISGKSYSHSIVSWYNIFFVILASVVIIRNLMEGSFKLSKLSFMSLQLITIGLITIFNSINAKDAVKQYINLIIPFILIIIGNNMQGSYSEENNKKILFDYIWSTNITGLGTLLQYLAKKLIDIKLGNYAFLGGYRHSFGFLFADYSFLSLYLVTGATLLLYLVDKGKINKKIGAINIIFLVITSVITSARTGIFAFIVVVGILSIPKFFHYLIYNFPRILILTLAVVVLAGTSFMLVGNIRGNRSLSDSGRGKLNQRAFEMFLENPILGVGFGTNNYSKLVGMIPHNLIFQYLAQGGLVFFVPLLIILYMILSSSRRRDPIIFGAILCILIGALFIPNIFNSRYMGAILLIFSIRDIHNVYLDGVKETRYES